MFGIGLTEMILVGLVALMLFSPRELPNLIKTLAGIYGSIRRTAEQSGPRSWRPTSCASRSRRSAPPTTAPRPSSTGPATSPGASSSARAWRSSRPSRR
ncbi:hypothetical protein OV079_25775 [Nannocystis pusilla]|uniref:Uncharacterized protein n=1 Tax=Nannocystis pusilla TaxID=889268 RepID=A0A9X3ET23_9BACT|nr:hypothetical protein [Nannocystis pusilla]MCY1008904.1 hypothetical protein [Nannocystis pusilla]